MDSYSQLPETTDLKHFLTAAVAAVVAAVVEMVLFVALFAYSDFAWGLAMVAAAGQV